MTRGAGRTLPDVAYSVTPSSSSPRAPSPTDRTVSRRLLLRRRRRRRQELVLLISRRPRLGDCRRSLDRRLWHLRDLALRRSRRRWDRVCIPFISIYLELQRRQRGRQNVPGSWDGSLCKDGRSLGVGGSATEDEEAGAGEAEEEVDAWEEDVGSLGEAVGEGEGVEGAPFGQIQVRIFSTHSEGSFGKLNDPRFTFSKRCAGARRT